MSIQHHPYVGFSDFSFEEMSLLQQAAGSLNEDQKQRFYMIYSNKRKNPQEILLLTLLGFICVAGIQRFVLGHIVLGVLYFFTGGFLFIGTIIDAVNYKSLALKYNTKMAYESYQIARMSN